MCPAGVPCLGCRRRDSAELTGLVLERQLGQLLDGGQERGSLMWPHQGALQPGRRPAELAKQIKVSGQNQSQALGQKGQWASLSNRGLPVPTSIRSNEINCKWSER